MVKYKDSAFIKDLRAALYFTISDIVHCQMIGFIPTGYKGPKLLMYRIISLSEEYSLLQITFHFLPKCTNFKK